MAQGTIDDRYAQTLVRLCKSDSQRREFSEQAKVISDSIYNNPLFKGMLNNPVVKATEKLEFIQKIYGDKIHPELLVFIQFLNHKKRLNILADILACFVKKAESIDNINRGIVTSAEALDDSQMQKIAERFQNKFGGSFILENKVEPELIGGFKVQVEHQVWDSSIRYKLESLKEKLLA